MKKIFLSVALFALLGTAFYSCSEDPETQDTPNELGTPNEQDPPIEVKTATEAQALVNSAYSIIQRLSSFMSVIGDLPTDIGVATGNDESADAIVASFNDVKPDNEDPVLLFSRLYTSIGSANIAIDRIDASAVTEQLTQANKDLYIARAKFIRGYDYFRLVKIYGEVPLVLKSGTSVTTRSSVDDVYNQIVKDLTEAAAVLPTFGEIKGARENKKSVPTKGAAYTVLADVYLTWAQHPLTQSDVATIAGTKNDPLKAPADAQKLLEAAHYANEVIKSGDYVLLDNFNNIWGTANENNGEVIFSINHDGDGIDLIGNHQTHCGFTFPKFPRKDPHLGFADITLENRFKENDSRKLFSYVSELEYTDGTVDTLTWPVSVVRPGKWINRVADGTYRATDIQPNTIDHIDYRYAEVLLIKAEAEFLLGNNEEALNLVNQIRKRAFGGSYEADGKLGTLTEEDLKKEWDYEFVFEQKRWFYLTRWKELLSTIQEVVPTFTYYSDVYATAESIKAAFPGVADAVNASFFANLHRQVRGKINNLNGKYYRFPIPKGPAGEDLGITPQNPGY
ncbi:RagB/SusD family nutrient uptake outer membrane protein [termite gut metagenome]|uniref:RagB/SusD family nutrient uptake outer membrane protein n=1 Tax=termite gut metagenome TaxID=433724 RepID=A0A5J4SLM4_9ZZZZ